MASIRRRNGRYHVQIRKNGYQTLTHTLSSLSLARKWAASVEADMERHLYIEVSESIILFSLLNRYDLEPSRLTVGQLNHYQFGIFFTHDTTIMPATTAILMKPYRPRWEMANFAISNFDLNLS